MLALLSSQGSATPSSSSQSRRLLYRGALSLPDSYLLLDGLTFSANLLANKDLLHNPLALALESMRGRPSLRFKGTEPLKNVSIEASDDVCMDIHPSAILSRVYFENILCLSRLTPDGRTEIGVRVALGDIDGPATTEMLIFGEMLSSSCVSITPSGATSSLSIRVARITAREVVLSKPRARGKEKVKEKGGSIFKVPALPPKKLNHPADADPFGTVGSAKGKARAGHTKALEEGIGDIEQENKSIIKKFTVRHLDAVGISKPHPEFKEIYGFVYRGTAFALRTTIKTSPVGARALDTLVEAHIKLYVT